VSVWARVFEAVYLGFALVIFAGVAVVPLALRAATL
jgi:hypothetical protein